MGAPAGEIALAPPLLRGDEERRRRRRGEEAEEETKGAGPLHSQGGLYGDARSEGGRISATGGNFWAKIRILCGIASGASGLSPPQAENFFENDAFKEKIY